jgi:MFS family permease
MCVLGLLYTFSTIDRQIPNLLLGYIRKDLQISDTMVSLLAGFAFALFYATSAIPISRLADQWSRKGVIFIGVVLWSGMTVFCGFSTSFWQFFIARLGVGLGEASLTPSAFAMASELFPPHRQARATSVFAIGPSIGGGLSLVLGGTLIGWAEKSGPLSIPGLGEMKIWQIVLIVIGLLTLLTTIPLAAIYDPVRQQRIAKRNGADLKPSVGKILRIVWSGRGGYAPLFLGTPLMSLAAYGVSAWTPTYFIRVHGWNAHDTGVIFGGVLAVVGVTSADRIRAAGRLDAAFKVMTALTLLAAPMPLVLAFSPSATLALIAIGMMNFLIAPIVVMAPVSLQAITQDGMRAQVTALYLLIINLVGLGLGPTIVALVTDFVFKNPAAVGWSMALVGSCAYFLSGSILFMGRRTYRSEVEGHAVALQD